MSKIAAADAPAARQTGNRPGFMSRVKIGPKLYAGFGVVILLLVAVAGISWNGLSTGEKSFDTYSSSASAAVVAAHVDTAMAGSLLAIREYIATGSDEARANFKKSEEVIRKLLADMKPRLKLEANKKLVAEIEGLIDAMGRASIASSRSALPATSWSMTG